MFFKTGKFFFFKRERDRCEVNKLKLKSKYRIMFLLCNLLTRAESPVRLPMASRIGPSFLMSNLRIF
ncbi:hypothetical protein B2G50_14760 [Leptospira interrogans serovar Canicola]|nr:hypothetical protein B2G50_14760 [Leptospira interrogans serovar Canicola]